MKISHKDRLYFNNDVIVNVNLVQELIGGLPKLAQWIIDLDNESVETLEMKESVDRWVRLLNDSELYVSTEPLTNLF